MQFAIDTVRSPLITTGTVRPVDKFGERGVQEVNEAGVPLWDVDCIVPSTSFGKPVTEVVAVRVPAPKQPEIGQYQPLQLERPDVSFYVGKGGVLRTNISAAGIAGGPAGRRSAEAA